LHWTHEPPFHMHYRMMQALELNDLDRVIHQDIPTLLPLSGAGAGAAAGGGVGAGASDAAMAASARSESDA